MLVRSLLIATVALTTPTLAAEQMAKSGSFKAASAFKGIEEAQQIGGHTLSHGVTYGIVTEDNPLHIKTANCPYISEISGDTVSLVGNAPGPMARMTSLLSGTRRFRPARGLLMEHKPSLEGPASSAASKVVIRSSVSSPAKRVSSFAPKAGLIS
jgi:hypothetical protein